MPNSADPGQLASSDCYNTSASFNVILQKPTDLDLHCLQKQGISRFSRTSVKYVSLYLQVLCSDTRVFYCYLVFFLPMRLEVLN